MKLIHEKAIKFLPNQELKEKTMKLSLRQFELEQNRFKDYIPIKECTSLAMQLKRNTDAYYRHLPLQFPFFVSFDLTSQVPALDYKSSCGLDFDKPDNIF